MAGEALALRRGYPASPYCCVGSRSLKPPPTATAGTPTGGAGFRPRWNRGHSASAAWNPTVAGSIVATAPRPGDPVHQGRGDRRRAPVGRGRSVDEGTSANRVLPLGSGAEPE